MYLNVHSYYSLRYGVLSVEDLVAGAVARNVKAMALTDINCSTGIFDFVQECRKNGIKPVVGMEIRKEGALHYVLLAQNAHGFQEINAFVSQFHLAGKPYPQSPPLLPNVFVIFPFQERVLNENEYVGISPKDIGKLKVRDFKDKNKLVILHTVTFFNDIQYKLHQHLRAVNENILLSRLTPDLHAPASEIMLSPEQFIQFYKDFPDAIKNTERLFEQCNFEFDFEEVKNKKTFTGSHYDDKLLLEKLALEGLNYRYGSKNKTAIERIKNELVVIDKLGFSSYFLITWDIIRYGMSRGFYHVGRGSGANSIVAYCLKITDVDPLELNLYFERFLNPKRSTPPDFDIDFSWKERDDVLDYMFKRYGRDHTALLGTMSTFRGNSIIRELAKTYGLPKSDIDRIADLPLDSSFTDEIRHNIFTYSKMVQNYPNIRSIHAGGVLISEKPITCFSALDLPPKGFPTVQWDMYVAEEIKFEKFDILSQRGIGHIKDCAELVLQNKKRKIDVHDVPTFKKDPQVRLQLKSGDTIGCFYIESPAMRQLLKKLNCETFLHLVAASSIIRPGVGSSGMMREYIHRFHHPESFQYLHPVMKDQLEETYGVMVYQEDVLKVCHHYAGMDLSDADLLRRAMSGKYRSKEAFNQLVDIFFDGAKRLGRSEETTKEIWRQVSSFGGYSFCKAHSASFAVESFQSLYLKAYFPHEFHVAVINNFGGFYSTWVYVKEAKKWGANILLPFVNRSEVLTTIDGDDIYLGFVHIQSLEQKLAAIIVEERICNGAYTSLYDFVKRTKITREQLFSLIRIGALREFGNKKELLWQSTLLIDQKVRADIKADCADLFDNAPKSYQLPELEENQLEDAYDEIELLGFPVTLNHFEMLQTKYRGNADITELASYEGKVVRVVGNFVTLKPVVARNGKSMAFGTFLDDKDNFFDTVHFPPSLHAYPFTGGGVYLIQGKVTCDFGVPAIEVEKMGKLPLLPDPRV